MTEMQGTMPDLRQIARFSIVGLLTAGIYVVTFHILVGSGAVAPFAAAAAYSCAILFQYFGHALFTFRAPWRGRAQVVRFIALNVTGFCLAILITILTVGVLGLPSFISSAAVVMILPVVNFVMMRLWVFPSES